MADAVSIPEDRPLSAHETTLVSWMLEHGIGAAAEFLPQLAEARVVSRCYCGCASVDFAVNGVVSPSGNAIGILADFEYRTAEGHLDGSLVFERTGLLAGLEVWSIDGLSTPTSLPTVEQLQLLVSLDQP